MNTGKHKIWIRLTKSKILIKLSDKKIDNVFSVTIRRTKKSRVSVRKKLGIRKALSKKELRLRAYMSDLGGLAFSEFMISDELWELIKGETEQIMLEYERYFCDEESMVF